MGPVLREIFLGSGGTRGLLDSKNMILARDLNFTTGANEVWGVET